MLTLIYLFICFGNDGMSRRRQENRKCTKYSDLAGEQGIQNKEKEKLWKKNSAVYPVACQ